MRSPLWMPCKRPLGQRAQWVHTVPTRGSWPFGSDTANRWPGDRAMQVPVPALGTQVFQELPQGGDISDACIGRDGVAPKNSLLEGFGDAQNGPHLKRWRAPTRVMRSLGVSRERVMVGHSGRYTEWRFFRSHACYRWAKRPPSGVEGPVAGAWGFTSSSVTRTSSEGGWGATAGRGCDGCMDREGSTSAIPLAHFCPQGSAYL